MQPKSEISITQEADILASIALGSESSFAELYRLYSDQVYNTAIGYVKNHEDAEEITQDVFTNIFKYSKNFKGDSSVSTWIYRITINSSLTVVNKKKKKFGIFSISENEHIHPDFEHPGVLLENKEEAQLLLEVINTLADNQKTAFILSYIEGLPRQEVAEIMETSLKSVESLLQRGKTKLRQKLEKSYPNRRKTK